MKKSTIVHLFVMVVAVICGSLLAQYLYKQQLTLAPYKAKLSHAPLAGFHKVASDVEWMFFINYLGSQSSVSKENVEEVTARLEKILTLDPNFEKAIEIGALSLSVEAPEAAVKMLKEACDNEDLKDNWKIPLYTALIITYNMKTPEQERAIAAIPYYRKAIERARSTGVQPFMVNSYINACAKKEGGDKEVAKLTVLFNEWQKCNVTPEAGGAFEAGVGMPDSLITDLDARILETMQKVKAAHPDDENINKRLDQIRAKVFKDRHICEKCCTPYVAGDKFCSKCGSGVEVYGVCVKCGEVLKGAFCWSCGAAAPVPAKAKVAPSK